MRGTLKHNIIVANEPLGDARDSAIATFCLLPSPLRTVQTVLGPGTVVVVSLHRV